MSSGHSSTWLKFKAGFICAGSKPLNDDVWAATSQICSLSFFAHSVALNVNKILDKNHSTALNVSKSFGCEPFNSHKWFSSELLFTLRAVEWFCLNCFQIGKICVSDHTCCTNWWLSTNIVILVFSANFLSQWEQLNGSVSLMCSFVTNQLVTDTGDWLTEIKSSVTKLKVLWHYNNDVIFDYDEKKITTFKSRSVYKPIVWNRSHNLTKK